MSDWKTADFNKEMENMQKMHQQANELHAREQEAKAREWVDHNLNSVLVQMRMGNTSYATCGTFDLTCEQRERVIGEFTSINPSVSPFFHRAARCESIWIETNIERAEESHWDRVRRMFTP